MTSKELAALLNGREYGAEITKDEEALAKASGLVVVFGYSDDNMEFRGAIHDEVGCYGGGVAYLTTDGLLNNDCGEDTCPYFQKLKKHASAIRSVWDDGVYSWRFDTAIFCEPFEIMEKGKLYCRGIVFALADAHGAEGGGK